MFVHILFLYTINVLLLRIFLGYCVCVLNNKLLYNNKYDATTVDLQMASYKCLLIKMTHNTPPYAYYHQYNSLVLDFSLSLSLFLFMAKNTSPA